MTGDPRRDQIDAWCQTGRDLLNALKLELLNALKLEAAIARDNRLTPAEHLAVLGVYQEYGR